VKGAQRLALPTGPEKRTGHSLLGWMEKGRGPGSLVGMQVLDGRARQRPAAGVYRTAGDRDRVCAPGGRGLRVDGEQQESKGGRPG
jgi:hypothetical protein